MQFQFENCFSTSVKTHEFLYLIYSQDRILVMHESPLICPLLKITPKALPAEAPADQDVAKAETSSTGLALGEFQSTLSINVQTTDYGFVLRLRVPCGNRHCRLRRLLSRHQKP